MGVFSAIGSALGKIGGGGAKSIGGGFERMGEAAVKAPEVLTKPAKPIEKITPSAKTLDTVRSAEEVGKSAPRKGLEALAEFTESIENAAAKSGPTKSATGASPMEKPVEAEEIVEKIGEEAKKKGEEEKEEQEEEEPKNEKEKNYNQQSMQPESPSGGSMEPSKPAEEGDAVDQLVTMIAPAEKIMEEATGTNKGKQ